MSQTLVCTSEDCSTKFYWANSALPSNVSNQLTHLIQDPGEDPYQAIKYCLISLYSLNNNRRFEALINLPLSDDTMLSILKSSMFNLYPKGFKSDFVFHGLFLGCMPPKVHVHLLNLDISDPKPLESKADVLLK